MTVANLDEKLGRLSAAGMLSESPKPLRRSTEAEVFLIRDPDENLLELESASEDSLATSPGGTPGLLPRGVPR